MTACHLCFAALVLCGTQLVAQGRDVGQVEVAAAAYVRSEAREAIIKVDSHFAHEKRERDAGRQQAIAQALRGSTASVKNVVSCPSGPASCSMSGANLFVAIGTPSMFGDRATVLIVTIHVTGDKDEPLQVIERQFTLVRRNSRWSVTRVDIMSAT
jgi:hypothetical protein